MTLHEVERQHILATLDRHNGNRTATAAELGISRRTLYYKLEEYEKQGFNVA
jgi:DNA-binding NtrC family response regulator